ncbi:MAG TPA: hypothetical protein VM841_14085 [Actinomycetota bacterium]|nr:hypothetical protein [Actinomycetota bacterium]
MFRIVVAVLAGLIIFGIGFSSIRGLTRPPGGGSGEPEPMDPRVRVLYWCENCGGEIMVLAQGSGMPYRHCGEKMIRREEVLRDN